MNAIKPIGVFDSGIGGLTVWLELKRQLPAESLVYLADSAFAPYGTRSREYIIDRSKKITRFLLDHGAKLIVVACNTATGAAISVLRKEFPVPFIGVEPAVKPAALESRSGHIGVLATEQTFRGEHFNRTKGLYGRSVKIHVRAGNGLVELIERGSALSDESRKLLEKYLNPMVWKGIDQLVLGCTHYPFLIPVIREILPPGVQIIDPSPAVARQTRKVLEENDILSTDNNIPGYLFYSSGDTQHLGNTVNLLTGQNPKVLQFDS
jgi:glutamate racemase